MSGLPELITRRQAIEILRIAYSQEDRPIFRRRIRLKLQRLGDSAPLPAGGSDA